MDSEGGVRLPHRCRLADRRGGRRHRGGGQGVRRASTRKRGMDMDTIRVRYMVKDLDPAVTFYTKHLGFQVKQEARPNFAMLSRGSLDLVLSTPFGPGGAAKPMLDGRHAEPGGWNRIIINVDDLAAEVARLRKADVQFRNEVATGP